VRELRETVKYAPASARFKIYIIDEVHMLTKEAFNALLKTLEEPPAHVKFMFATTEPEKVLPTILSRCQRFDLRRIPSGLIVKQLRLIAKLESVKIDEPALEAIARGADGGMRDAESALDQLISFCGGDIAEADVLSMFGLAAQGQILGLSQAVLAGETTGALRQLNELAQQGKDLARIVSELLRHFRNLLIFQVARGELGLIEASEAEAAALAVQSPLATADALTRMMDVLTDCEGRLRDTASRKILVEVTLLKMMEARHAVSIDTVLRQLQQLRAEAGGVAQRSAPASAPATGRAPAPVAGRPASPPAAPVQHPLTTPAVGGDLGQLWDRLVEAASKASPFISSYLREARPVSLAANVLTIGFDPEFAEHKSLVDNSRNRELLQTKLTELGHPHVQVKFVEAAVTAAFVPVAPPVVSPAAAAPAPVTPAGPVAKPVAEAAPPKPRAEPVANGKEDFKNDPLIQKALEIFKGQIVEAR
jgi:DNA polymerase-3 subunit gamma/tau